MELLTRERLTSEQAKDAQGILAKVVALNLIAIVGTIVIFAPFQGVEQQFEDGGFITYFSVVQLFLLSYFAFQIFLKRAKTVKHPWQSSITIWGIIGLGFSFLALDEWLMIHEGMDKFIHKVGKFQETGMSDRIDDVIVGLYGLIAIGLFVLYRHEIKKYRSALPYVVTGFVLLFLMVGVDALTNRDDWLLLMFSRETTTAIMGWIFVPEESLKLLSEAFLIGAAYTCRQIAKRLSAPDTRQLPEADNLETAGPGLPL